MQNTNLIDAYQAMKISGEILDENKYDEIWIDAHSLWFDAGEIYVRLTLDFKGLNQ